MHLIFTHGEAGSRLMKRRSPAMKNIFVSYSRSDENVTHGIVKDIQDLGYRAWFDRELTGGQNWWNRILEEIRKADIFFFILSPSSRSSTACKRELDYAVALNKLIIPIQVSNAVSTSLLPPALSKVQIVDYIQPDNKASGIRLARALSSISDSDFKPLPDPLPRPPEVPISYIADLSERIENRPELSRSEQSEFLLDIKKAISHEDISVDDAVGLLANFRRRSDLYASIADEIDKLKSEIANRPSSKEERTTRSAAGPATNSEPVSETQKGNNWKNIGWIILFFVGLNMVLYELALV
jgi:hypothetical protein